MHSIVWIYTFRPIVRNAYIPKDTSIVFMSNKISFNDRLSSVGSGTQFKKKYDTLAEFVAERMPQYMWAIYPHQERWFDAVRKNKFSLILTPRNHAKTETMAILVSLYFMCSNHNLQITYVREKAEKAEEIVYQIKKIIRENPQLEITIDEPDRANKFNVVRSMNLPSATFLGTGIESGETGGRSDLMIFDDIETEKNTKTERDVEKHIHTYEKVFFPMGNPECKYIFIGTKQMDKDIYYHIQKMPYFKNNIMIDKMINPYVPRFIIDEVVGDEIKYHTEEDISDFYLLWPEIRGWKYATERYFSMNHRNFMMEFQQECPPPDECPFKEEWIQYYTDDQLPADLKIYIGLDPAVVASKRNSFLAMSVIGIDEKQSPPRFYLLDTLKKRIAPTEGYKETLKMYYKWMPNTIYVEDNAYQGAIVSQLKDFNNIPNAVGTQSREAKEDRIMKLADLFEMKIVYIKEDMIDFLQEYRNFKYKPGANKEIDLMDSFHIAIRMELSRLGFLGCSVDFSKIRVSVSDNYVPHRISRQIEHAVRRNVSQRHSSNFGRR